MTLLGIETSCDETGASIIQADTTTNNLTIISNVIASSLSLHAKTGGIIPEVAARAQITSIQTVLSEALTPLGADLTTALNSVDAIAVTYGPGLIGSLLVGVETARSLSYLSSKPLIPVNHMYGHIYANFIGKEKNIPFPALALVVSGGHTDLVLMKSHKDISVIGGTRDDAAGEAFDKIGRLLNLPYPAGPIISRLAQKGNPKSFILPRPMIGSKDYNFSFSGLKTAVLNLVKKNNWDFSDAAFARKNTQLLSDLCASVEWTIVNVLTRKTIQAAKEKNVASLLLGGGVAANNYLEQSLLQKAKEELPHLKFFIPPKELCTDNAAMIASAGYFQHTKVPWQKVVCDPELYY
jgi:N6-L-threonylcarbamoyladenine synthase